MGLRSSGAACAIAARIARYRRPANATAVNAANAKTFRTPASLGLLRQQHVRIEATVVTGVTCRAHLVDLQQHRVAVTVQPNRMHVLRMARRGALDPLLTAGT